MSGMAGNTVIVSSLVRRCRQLGSQLSGAAHVNTVAVRCSKLPVVSPMHAKPESLDLSRPKQSMLAVTNPLSVCRVFIS